MESKLSSELQEYLRRGGVSRREMARCTPETRMYHDLNVYGEIAEGFLEVLIDDYHVDMSGFEFDTYFPPEFMGNSRFTAGLLFLIPFGNYMARKRHTYQPLTLAMIEKVIQTKRWSSLSDS